MSQIRELLIHEMQDLLHAEEQLVAALPKMVKAARSPQLKQGFETHLGQTKGQVERLKQAFALMGEKGTAKPCKGMKGIIEEGQETIEEMSEKEDAAADLALIIAAQKVEHYEIAAYGSVRALARQIGEIDVAALLSHTLGEEESSDHLLTGIAQPLLQQAALEDHVLVVR